MRKQILVLMTLMLSMVVIGGLVSAAPSANVQASATIPTYLSLTLSPSSVLFGANVIPGTEVPATNNPLVATIGGESNTNVLVSTQASGDLSDGSHTITLINMLWDTNNGFTSPLPVSYTTAPATVCPSILPGATCSIYNELNVPGGTHSGTYTTTITVTGAATV